MKRRIFAIIQYLFFLGAGLFLVWWQLRSMTSKDMDSFFQAILDSKISLAVPVILIALLSYVSRAIRWKILMEPMGYHPSLKNALAATFIGYLANAAVPRLGEVLKCSILAKYEKIRVDKLIGTIVSERLFDFFCYIIFIGITILFQMDIIGNFVQEKLNRNPSGGDTGGALRYIVILVLIAAIVILIRYVFKRNPDNLILTKARDFYSGLSEGIGSIRKLKKRKSFIFHTVLIWTLYVLQVYIGFFAIEQTAVLGFPAALSVLSLATLAMILTPGGIGSFPFFVMETLKLYQISPPVGNAFGWLMWGVNTLIIIIFGCLSLLLLPAINKKKNHEAGATHTG